MADELNQPEEPASSGTVDEKSLEPVGRDSRFIYRLVLLFVLAIIGAVILGAWMRGAAAHCGANLVRPGSTVIPPQ